MMVARDGVEPPTPAFSGYSQPISLFGQLLNVSRWPQFCDHSVTSADVRLSVGAAGLSSTDPGDLKVAKVRIFSSAHSDLQP